MCALCLFTSFRSNLALFRFLMRKKDELKRCIWNWICHIFSVRERALCSPTASQDMIVEIFVDFASEFYYGFAWFYRIFGSFYFKYCTIFTWILSICISFNNKYFFSLSLLRHESNAFYVFTSFSIKYFSALQVYVALDIGVYLFIWLFNAEKKGKVCIIASWPPYLHVDWEWARKAEKE